MTKIVFLLTCSFLLVAISVLFSQEILSDNSPEKLVLLDEKILADIPFPGNIYTVSKSGLVAFLVQSDQGYGLKKIFIKEGNTVIREISESGCTLFSLVFSNDSQWFKYGIREKSKAAKVKLINLKNGNTVEINNGNFDCGDLDFSPDNEKFVYRRDLGTGKARNTEIVISDFNQQAHVIAFNGNWPKWSPAGNNLAFTKVEHFENSTQWGKCIWLYDIEKNSESKVNGSAGMGTGLLSWSPSGKESLTWQKLDYMF